MKIFLIPLLTALTITTAVNAEVINDYMLKITEALKLHREGKFSEMKNICEELIEIFPENPNGYVCKGFALGFTPKSKRKSREALKNFTKAIELDPENYANYFFRGQLKFSMYRREKSKLQMTGCNDIKKAYLNKYPAALEYVKRNKNALIKSHCSGFF